MAPERPGSGDENDTAVAHKPVVSFPIIPVFNAVVQVREGDGAVIGQNGEREDDDLTSLTWLQDKNLLKGINLRAAVGDTQESPTSDYVDDSVSEQTSSSSSHSPTPYISTPIKQKHPQHMPYDPKVHINSKPPYSFSCLIFMAIEDSPQRALPVKDIYAWILDHFPYFKNAPTGWKNSVRHNLSLNKCFRKVEKAPNLGKGSLWMVDDLYRPNLVQALQKAPFHPLSAVERVTPITNNNNNNNINNNNTSNGSTPSPQDQHIGSKTVGRLPNPELFPFLSRRLAASGVHTGDESECLDDVDAAAAMLALKHGPRMLSAAREISWYKRPDEEDVKLDLRSPRKKLKLNKPIQESPGDSMVPVITTSPSEDHTYSAANSRTVQPTSSPDEAYEEGSDTEEEVEKKRKKFVPQMIASIKTEITEEDIEQSDAEERRKIAEGADALLNLAGIATRRRSSSDPQMPDTRVRKKPERLTECNTPFRPRILRPIRPKKRPQEPVPRQKLIPKRRSSQSGSTVAVTPPKQLRTIKPLVRNSTDWEKLSRSKR